MDQAVREPAESAEKHGEQDVAVAVITPVGIYPDEDDFRRVAQTTVIDDVLKAAAVKLKITNTTDWIAKVDGQKIDISKTFKHEKLTGIVEIEYHKHEGGGGA
jgi:hypothetical protein